LTVKFWVFGAEFYDVDFIARKVLCSRMSDDVISISCTVQRGANFAGNACDGAQRLAISLAAFREVLSERAVLAAHESAMGRATYVSIVSFRAVGGCGAATPNPPPAGVKENLYSVPPQSLLIFGFRVTKLGCANFR